MYRIRNHHKFRPDNNGPSASNTLYVWQGDPVFKKIESESFPSSLNKESESFFFSKWRNNNWGQAATRWPGTKKKLDSNFLS